MCAYKLTVNSTTGMLRRSVIHQLGIPNIAVFVIESIVCQTLHKINAGMVDVACIGLTTL